MDITDAVIDASGASARAAEVVAEQQREDANLTPDAERAACGQNQ
jgi:heterodisulfide reductase subunit A-like polyferredoxin